jgi:CubicO group peptidase (beta-lactamase class C family)
MNRIIKFSLSLALTLFSLALFAQTDISQYEGQWEGRIQNSGAFHFTLELGLQQDQKASLVIKSDRVILKKEFSVEGPLLQLSLGENLSLKGYFTDDRQSFRGFLQSGILQYHIELENPGDGKYSGQWNILMLDELLSNKLYLSMENVSGDQFEAYPFFGDTRFTGTWCANFSRKDNKIFFSDFKTGLQFEGALLEGEIELQLKLAGNRITTIRLIPSEGEWQRGVPEDDQPSKMSRDAFAAPQYLKQMEDSLRSGALTYTHAILVSKKGELVYENYFSGYNADIPHDQRSASKSVASTIIGLAIDEGVLENEKERLSNHLPESHLPLLMEDGRKLVITLEDLLTMSSGLDAVDFGVNRNSAAAEHNYQSSSDWLKTVIQAPMIHEPGTHALYGSANPYLLGVALNQQLDIPLALFMDQQLFSKLGVSNYIIQNDITGAPYFGGGMYLTPRDMIRYGQLYLNQGKWKGEQVLSQGWVEKSFRKYRKLENANDKNEYGYLWWHKTYRIGDRDMESVEARGAGGQYIMVIPELELVVAITSGNFSNGRFWQPELIVEEYILPAVNGH